MILSRIFSNGDTVDEARVTPPVVVTDVRLFERGERLSGMEVSDILKSRAVEEPIQENGNHIYATPTIPSSTDPLPLTSAGAVWLSLSSLVPSFISITYSTHL